MPIPNKYFIQEHLHREVFHGGIGNVDAEKNFIAKGYQPIEFPGTYDFSIGSKWKRLLYLIRLLFRIRSGDLVIFQFPLYAKVHELLLTLLRIKGVKIACLILDIDGLRNGNDNVLEKEKKAFRRFRLFIVHNERMRQWLQPIVPHATIAELQFFDFLATPVHQHRSKDTHIIIAGDLQKNAFIQKLGQLTPLTFSIYGAGYSEYNAFPENATYKGVFPPYELVQHLQGSFGLVWYGPEIESFAGNYGSYLTIITPHKLSLFIMAGIPLIVPATSASAILVKQYGIGCTINRLSEIGEVIKNISDSAYQQMVENTRPLAVQLSQGHFMKSALTELEQTVYGN
ncbi:hypothetical protein FAM09_30250 [Niastella caeni]|uniref:Beta-1,6-galactofuranosyltransferase n=1 Tax=Niastella caeni TaxID=2569763 RepID=A0A4S8H8P3_9BACT|nr:hypothetical protein [Niastella caeni]THU30441.1 hypothetical protein FAM09_30250 [Niastella caeni]